jgi:hypothetical protein
MPLLLDSLAINHLHFKVIVPQEFLQLLIAQDHFEIGPLFWNEHHF